MGRPGWRAQRALGGVQVPAELRTGASRRAPCQYKDKSPRASSAATSAAKTLELPKRSFSRPEPSRVIPRHVRACQHSEHGAERWFVWTWKRENPTTQTRIPYSCNSWRCPVCARHEAAVTFARIKQAVQRPELAPDGWVFLVLTIDRDGYYSGQPWPDVTTAYRSLGKMSEKFLKRLRRAYGLGSQWVAVVESHKSGWPHVNLMLYSPELADEIRSAKRTRASAGASPRDQILVGERLLEHAMECGWGRQSTADVARDTEALSSYIVKLAGNHEASVGELAKITQAPLAAPARFRRLRSGKGFLPPRHKNAETTGVLIRRAKVAEQWRIIAVNGSEALDAQDGINRAIRAELDVIREEREIIARSRRLPAMPPLRIARGGQVEPHKQTSAQRWASQVRALALESA